MNPVEVIQGDSPVILGLPHTGLHVPDPIAAQLNETGRALTDTDWHIHTLYEGLLPSVSSVRATFHRYVIDANRDPSGQSLYPGQYTTALCPLSDFDDNPIYQSGMEPDSAQVEQRRLDFHAPYHAALETEIRRVHARHGIAILYDCHSIRSRAPRLFDGVLPDFNIGTNNGATCAAQIEALVSDICARAEGFSSISNGRFKGGWTTRHYGNPGNGVHAIQMELAQITHLQTEKAPYALDALKAEHLRQHLKDILVSMEHWALTQVERRG